MTLKSQIIKIKEKDYLVVWKKERYGEGPLK